MEGQPEAEVSDYGVSSDPASDQPMESAVAGPRRSRKLILGVSAAIAAVVIVVLALALLGVLGGGGIHLGGSSTPPTTVRINVLTLNFTPANNSCLLTEFQSTHGSTVIAGGEIVYNVSLQNSNPGGARDCSVTGLAIATAGFSIASSNVPLAVGTSAVTLTFTLATPSTAYNGSVTVTANVTFQKPDIHVQNQNFTETGGGGQCGSVSASSIGFSGFDSSTYSDSALAIAISPSRTCSVTSIALVGAPGFSISGTNLPVQLPSDSLASITFTLHLPTAPFQGSLNYTLTLS